MSITSAQVLRKMNEIQAKGGPTIGHWHQLRLWLKQDEQVREDQDDDMFCSEHQCEKHLVDYDDGSRYECPECERERGEALGLR